MTHRDIDSITYLIKKAKRDGSPKPIVLLGAGASVTAGIPLANEIMADISTNFNDKPEVKNLAMEDRSYAKIMACLNAGERNELLRTYIKNAKINVAHIYLAQLLKNNYIDYVLTVNFDDLMLRASSLFNFIPPTFDMAILKDTTTTTLPTGSVIYLHGQHHGLWLLNTESEMAKVKERVTQIFNKICNDRPWIIIGYSGGDPVFDVLATKLGRFDNDLFWVGYMDGSPSERVKKMLFEEENNGAYWIKNYDCDSFFLKLHSELDIETPAIFNTPFSYLKSVTENIQDINIPQQQESGENKKSKTNIELFKHTKERSENSKKLIEDAIKVYEKGEHQGRLTESEIMDNNFQKEIIELITKQDYNKAKQLLEDTKDKDSELYNSLHNTLYTSWAYSDYEKWVADPNSDHLEESLLKYDKVDEQKLKDHVVFNNWGVALYNKARKELDIGQFERVMNQSIKKYKKATELNPEYELAFGNWGLSLQELGNKKEDEKYFLESIEKTKEAVRINPTESINYVDWGNAISRIAKLRKDPEYYDQSIEKYKEAIKHNPKSEFAYIGLGNALVEIATPKKDLELLDQSIEKYEKVLQINKRSEYAYYGLGNTYSKIASIKGDSKLFLKSIDMYNKALSINSEFIDTYINLGLDYYELSKLENSQEYNKISIDNFRKALKINAKDALALDNLGVALRQSIAYVENEYEKAAILNEAENLFEEAAALDGMYFNLACMYALQGKKEKALDTLEKSLSKKQQNADYVLNDEDWESLKKDPDFIALINKFK